MQGWAHGSSLPCKGYAAKKTNAGSTAAERARQGYLRQQYRLSLEKDVSSLQRKLRQEIDTHKALERAFRRTLGVLPRISPGLTPKVQELLAEVAVLEEEVINLEESIVALRQGLYNEAVCISASKQQKEVGRVGDSMNEKEGLSHPNTSPQVQQMHIGHEAKRNCVIAKLLPVLENTKARVLATSRLADLSEDGKSPGADTYFQDHAENKQCTDCNSKQICITPKTSINVTKMIATVQSTLLPAPVSNSDDGKAGCKNGKQQETKIASKMGQKNVEFLVQVESAKKIQETSPKFLSLDIESGDAMEPNPLSEEMVLCLCSIFLRLTKQFSGSDWETSSNISHSTMSSMWTLASKSCVSQTPSMDVTEEIKFVDPYNIFDKSMLRNVGPYQYYHEVICSSFDYSKIPRAASFLKKLMNLLEKLKNVDLRGLAHQQKLSFWINIYNGCMMHAFLEHGIPDSPEKVVALMGKAVVNVGGHRLSALAIEHFILRLPCGVGSADLKSKERTMEGQMRSTYGLDWPEPSVSFALCCGSRSSPALRIYTPQEVETELEMAKKEYLQATVGVTSSKIVIPKMLEWYMRDFAKDAESLIDWVSEQLPSATAKLLQNCLGGKHVSEITEVMPYDFSFRYLFAMQPL